MATRIASKDELTRLKRAREAADRAYNDALTRVDRALPPRPELPDAPGALDQRQLTPVNEAWRVAPDVEPVLGTGWKRRLRAWVWDLVGPIVERQQHFNAVLVDHLNRTAPAAAEGQQALTAIIAALAEHTAALEAFQSRLIQYLQQITAFVETKDREAGLLQNPVFTASTDRPAAIVTTMAALAIIPQNPVQSHDHRFALLRFSAASTARSNCSGVQ